MSNEFASALSGSINDELSKMIPVVVEKESSKFISNLAEYICDAEYATKKDLVKIIKGYLYKGASEDVLLSLYSEAHNSQKEEDSVWVGKMCENFEDGNSRESCIIGGTSYKSPTYFVASKLAQEATSDSSLKGSWGFKKNLKMVKNIWMLPLSYFEKVQDELETASIPYVINNEYWKKEDVEEDPEPEPVPKKKIIKKAVKPKAGGKSKATPKKKAKAAPKKEILITKELYHKFELALLAGKIEEDKTVISKKLGCTVIQAAALLQRRVALELEHGKPEPPKEKIQKIVEEVISFKTGLKVMRIKGKSYKYSEEHCLLFQTVPRKQYPNNLYCVGYTEVPRDLEQLYSLRASDVDILRKANIKYDEDNVDDEDEDVTDDEVEADSNSEDEEDDPDEEDDDGYDEEEEDDGEEE